MHSAQPLKVPKDFCGKLPQAWHFLTKTVDQRQGKHSEALIVSNSCCIYKLLCRGNAKSIKTVKYSNK